MAYLDDRATGSRRTGGTGGRRTGGVGGRQTGVGQPHNRPDDGRLDRRPATQRTRGLTVSCLASEEGPTDGASWREATGVEDGAAARQERRRDLRKK